MPEQLITIHPFKDCQFHTATIAPVIPDTVELSIIEASASMKDAKVTLQNGTTVVVDTLKPFSQRYDNAKHFISIKVVD